MLYEKVGLVLLICFFGNSWIPGGRVQVSSAIPVPDTIINGDFHYYNMNSQTNNGQMSWQMKNGYQVGSVSSNVSFGPSNTQIGNTMKTYQVPQNKNMNTIIAKIIKSKSTDAQSSDSMDSYKLPWSERMDKITARIRNSRPQIRL